MSIFSRLIVIVALLYSWGLYAQVNIKVDPPTPVKGETFNVIFEVKTDSNDDPYVSFTPIGLEVLGRRKEVSLQTTMINGKFSSSRNYNLIYSMVSDIQRTARLKDISIEVGGKTYKKKPLAIKVLGQRKKASKLFLRAEVSKDNVYLGEGVDVRYYLYSRVQVAQTEIKAFPKLKGFIKRFHKVDEREQAVEYQGLVYKRSLKYSARVYPEKTGKLSIDPLRLVIQYADGRSNPFGGIGFGFSRFRSKGVNSPKVSITVVPLPAEGVPPHFTGLVGKHEFSFAQAKNKFVVNEAIEGTLEVRGPGALEKMDAPVLYSNPALEQFDAKGEFVELGRSEGRKTFQFTYLARANLSLDGKKLPLSYFDPESKKYVTEYLELPSLEVIGGANASGVVGNSTKVEDEAQQDEQNFTKGPLPERVSISAPLFSNQWKRLPLGWSRYVEYALIILVILLLVEFSYYKVRESRSGQEVEGLFGDIKKRGPNYSNLSKALFLLEKKDSEGDVGLDAIVRKSPLSQKDKDYFLDLIQSLEEKDFSSTDKKAKRARYRSSSFKALKKVINNESI